MKLLKALVILNLSFVATYAYASEEAKVKQLRCTNSKYTKFLVVLDSSTFEPGSNLFRPTNVRFVEGFYGAQNMACEGVQLQDLTCIGYLNGSPDRIVEVKTAVDADGAITATSKFLRNKKDGPIGRTIKCEIVEL